MDSRDGLNQSLDEGQIEKRIVEAGLTAPRVTPELIDAQIVSEAYHVFPGTTLTVCCLTLRNGFHVIGESAAASPENFNEEVGQDVARRNARTKIWSLEGYALRNRLALEKLSKPLDVRDFGAVGEGEQQ